MAADNENGNSDVNNEKKGDLPPNAQLIADALENGFKRLEKEMDQREKFTKMVVYGLLFAAIIAAPSIAGFVWHLEEALEKEMKFMNNAMGTMSKKKGTDLFLR